MKSLYDIQQLLKSYGVYIYTGDRMGDLALIEMEINELYRTKMIELAVYQQCRLLLQQEKRKAASEEK